MMCVLSDVALKRAGFDPELRDRIAAAWRAEDYHTAGQLIPDELLDAFMLCGTREEVAGARRRVPRRPAWTCRCSSRSCRKTSRSRSSSPRRGSTASRGGSAANGPAAAGRPPRTRAVAAPTSRRCSTAEQRVGVAVAARSARAGALVEILRPFSFTASTFPVRAGGRARRARRAVRLAPVPGRAAWRGAAARRHERDQRDLRRAQGRRHDHLAAREPRAS